MKKETKKARLNQRRYAEIVKMLKSVISNPKATIDRRMRAGDTLLSLYERHDRANDRRERAAADAEPETPEVATETQAEPELSAEEAAQRFLASVRAKYGDQSNAE